MRTLLAGVCLALFVAVPLPTSQVSPFRYERTVTVSSAARDGTACAALDAAVYAHAMPSLKDLRLFRKNNSDNVETAYAVTLSESSEAESEAAMVRNLGERGGRIVFDLSMPARPYTDVMLDLDARNFIASAEVSGSTGEGSPVHLGTFILFDLSAQRLGQGTTMPLQESSFPDLHVALRFLPVPGQRGPTPGVLAVRGASVPPSREAQTRYTPVVEAASIAQQGTETVARFTLPAHVPVERVAITLEPEFARNFSRDVTVTAHTAADEEDERLTGLVQRVRWGRVGLAIRQEQLGFAATLGANLQADATVEVRIQNGDDPPLPLKAVRLEMRERRLCFPTGANGELRLFYGDPSREAPRYDFARTFSPAADVTRATLSAESLNPGFVAREASLPSWMDRHPEFLWVVLLAVVCVLAVVAIHSAKRLPRQSG